MTDLFSLVDLLAERHALSHEAYRALVEGQSPELAAYAAKKADAMRREIYGTDVYVRGLIEIGNYCRNDCIYCGIRKSNKTATATSLPENRFWSAVKRDGILDFVPLYCRAEKALFRLFRSVSWFAGSSPVTRTVPLPYP